MTSDSETLTPVDPQLWGKQHGLPREYPVVCHLLDTAAMAGALWDGLLSHEAVERLSGEVGVDAVELRQLVCLWAGLHDIGKISPAFQRKCSKLYEALQAADSAYGPASTKELRDALVLDHDEATHWVLVSLLEEFGYPPSPRGAHRGVGHQIAQMLGGHHGRFHPAMSRQQARQPRLNHPGLGTGVWEEQCRAHAEAVRRMTRSTVVPPRHLPASVAVVVAGLVIVADWLASQESFIAPRIPASGWSADDDGLLTHWERSVKDAPAVVREAGLGRAAVRELSFREMFGFEPNSLQASLVDELPELVRGPGLLLVTAPPGDGKTEAALFGASVLMRAAGANGVGFSLPTMATADAMYERVRAFAERTLDGDAALTRVHSMAWLSADAATDAAASAATAGPVLSSEHASVEAARWLHTTRRGMLAPLSVFTIDQALAGVLPLRYNVLRMLALSGKVLVIDEAHAYGPWMHALLLRLLEWLGAMGAPVVVLSATLTGSTAGSLLQAYRRGCGQTGDLTAAGMQPRYPGWVYVDGAPGAAVSKPRGVPSERERVLEFRLLPVRRNVGADDARHRWSVVKELLRPVVEDCRGTVLVCCTTVAEAQETAASVQAWLAERAGSGAEVPDLHLLHSRYRAGERRRITEGCETSFGKTGPRPRAAILVATQIVEQSLDLDFDLLITDIAPLALLLQRAGRCQRHKLDGYDLHAAQRPAWAAGDPRIVVLDPVNEEGEFEQPRVWGSVYHESLLRRTSELLARRAGGRVQVPGDVQELVDAVYAEEFGGDLDEKSRRELETADTARRAEEAAEAQLADMVRVKAPKDVGQDLRRLSESPVPVGEDLIATRLGADSERVVCAYEQDSGKWTLDEDGRIPVPGLNGEARVRRDGARLIAQYMIPAPGRWFREGAELLDLPETWEKNAVLKGWKILPMHRRTEAGWQGRVQRGTVRYSDFGLITI
ncbi:CRISPR-associated helicase Cas3' [Streptomyces sp. GC420]|uniref:CRISPR-associated helicase Cas3' n=1 Tax=Streptomyces sp. GC420 TaxID=2697568 RepID=UPI001414E9D6|nr:CRISPR-associated helicase Cas3' [Streptomyces sp. GC420]NBM20089.1 CRISPR-associated helicase Cas3' [Streptomyces sp. GC420]